MWVDKLKNEHQPDVDNILLEQLLNTSNSDNIYNNTNEFYL